MANLTLEEWIARLKKNKGFNANAAAVVDIPAKSGDFEDYPSWVNQKLRDVLARRGMERLYRHQAQAVRFIRNGQDVVLVTPTASGKTLCYNLPVLDAIREAESVILSAPVYFGCPCAQYRLLEDRFYSFLNADFSSNVAAGKKLAVTAAFDNLAIVHDADKVSVANGGKTVRNNNGSAFGQQFPESILNQQFG